ncbi:hypothetical protein V6Z11_D03G126000 [Gossypium hirsutum]
MSYISSQLTMGLLWGRLQTYANQCDESSIWT